MPDYKFSSIAVPQLGEMLVTYSGEFLYHTLTDTAQVTL